MTSKQLLSEIKACLAAVYKDRLRGVVLYGSEARGNAQPDSDIDVLVLLDGPVKYGRDLENNIAALYPLSSQIGRRISAKPVDAAEYNSAQCPLYQNVHQEGIAA